VAGDAGNGCYYGKGTYTYAQGTDGFVFMNITDEYGTLDVNGNFTIDPGGISGPFTANTWAGSPRAWETNLDQFILTSGQSKWIRAKLYEFNMMTGVTRVAAMTITKVTCP
jgi:hypothetical protein